MKATGVVRRIDDLGRVVIPKEIRRTLRIREGDPLEIFTDREGGVILKKYSPIGELTDFSKEYAESLQQAIGHIILISDKDAFVSVSGASKKDYIERYKGKNPTIISCNCIGGIIYNELNLQFLSPTINLYMNCEDFIKFCENMEYRVKSLEFKKSVL